MTAAPLPACPLCGGTRSADFKGRVAERCMKCGALIRIRSAWLMLTEVAKVDRRSRIAHFAPEEKIAPRLHALCGDRYEAYDLAETRYAYDFPVRHFDLCTDVPGLRAGHYDVVLHNHVIEHVTCNYTIVLQQLHRLLRPGGWHIFSVPVGRGYFRDNTDPRLTAEERLQGFGKDDHIRRFAREDFDRTLGMVFGLGNDWSMADLIAPERLRAAAIPEGRWTVRLGPVFAVQKQGDGLLGRLRRMAWR
jgi:SAM-dependent methyltransferase